MKNDGSRGGKNACKPTWTERDKNPNIKKYMSYDLMAHCPPLNGNIHGYNRKTRTFTRGPWTVILLEYDERLK